MENQLPQKQPPEVVPLEPLSQEEHILPLPDPERKEPSKLGRLKDWYLERKKWTVPATLTVLVLVLMAVPTTRYNSAGLVLKQQFSLKVVDSTNNKPVSEATVSAGGVKATTDGDGIAKLQGIPVGTRNLVVSKKYYKDQSSSFLVPILDQKTVPTVSLVATGRQVSVAVKNYVSKKPLAKVSIKISDIEATTDKDGRALLVLPADKASQEAVFSLDGFNKSQAAVTVTPEGQDDLNTFELVPNGKVYFMSKRTGKLDLMKSNLDGSEAQVVVGGTGNEQDYRTSLVPSANFTHVALLTKRNSQDPGPQLYIVDSSDKLQPIENGNYEFYVYGWAGKSLIYTITNNDLPDWQTGKHKLKSYDASSGKTVLLDQTAGTDEMTNLGESYRLVSVAGGYVIYAKDWFSYYSEALVGKQHSLHTISANGQNHKLVTTFDASKFSVYYRQRSHSGLYIMQNGENEKTYFDYKLGGQPKKISLDEDKFYESFPQSYLSPSGTSTVWADLRDGKDVILVGDESGGSSKIIATLEEFGIYGWLTDEYILLSKKQSEIYVIDKAGGEPVKVTDYQAVNGAYRYY